MLTKKNLLVLTLLIWFGSPLYTFAQDIPSDSTLYIKKKIKDDIKATKRLKARQIKRIETKDSTIIYGADKLRTHIVHVHSFNKLEKRNLQFTYDEKEIIFIGVLKGTKKMNGLGYKEKNSAYYFNNGKLIHSENGDTGDDITFLLAEAERFLRQGKLLLEHL